MSQPNPSQSPQPSPQDRMVTIRMKPGRGRMLIGRGWKMNDGTSSKARPKNYGEVAETEEEYLGEREMIDGQPGPGPTARVPVSLIASLLGKDGKPNRVIEGYVMVKHEGDSNATDEHGNRAPNRTDFSPGLQAGIFDDSTFEIVPEPRST